MKLVTFSVSGRDPAPGIERADGSVVDIAGVLGHHRYPTVARLMGSGQSTFDEIDRIMAAVDIDPERFSAEGELLPAGSFRLHSPLGERVLMVCAGANYKSHLAEMGQHQTDELAWFVQNPNSVIGSGESIVLPSAFPDKVDFEGELCVVFGRACHAVSEEDALAHIGGYTIMNDVSARDELSHLLAAATPEEGRYSWLNMLLGKQFPTFSAVGPAIVTSDEIADPNDLQLTTTVNATVMQDANTLDLTVGIPELIARLSRYFAFVPGDVLSTGTPAGVGAGQQPPVYLRPGDRVEVSVTGIGSLVNTISASSSQRRGQE